MPRALPCACSLVDESSRDSRAEAAQLKTTERERACGEHLHRDVRPPLGERRGRPERLHDRSAASITSPDSQKCRALARNIWPLSGAAATLQGRRRQAAPRPSGKYLGGGPPLKINTGEPMLAVAFFPLPLRRPLA
jgi:hypothetical protein